MNGTNWTGSADLSAVADLNWQIVGTGDFNRDGNVDILWRYNGPGGYNVIWYMNGTNWAGTVDLSGVSDLNWQIVGTGDFNLDGDVDILWRYNGTGGYNHVWYMKAGKLDWDRQFACRDGLELADRRDRGLITRMAPSTFSGDITGPAASILIWYMTGANLDWSCRFVAGAGLELEDRQPITV